MPSGFSNFLLKIGRRRRPAEGAAHGPEEYPTPNTQHSMSNVHGEERGPPERRRILTTDYTDSTDGETRSYRNWRRAFAGKPQIIRAIRVIRGSISWMPPGSHAVALRKLDETNR